VYIAVYDPPQKLLNRHNELHVILPNEKEEEVHPTICVPRHKVEAS
jgi:hypothetical protein